MEDRVAGWEKVERAKGTGPQADRALIHSSLHYSPYASQRGARNERYTIRSRRRREVESE